MIRIKQIKVNILDDNDINIKNIISKKLGINVNDIKNYKVIKKSIDARYKPDIFYIYELDINCNNEDRVKKRNKSLDISISKDDKYIIPKCGNIYLKNRPIIVGSGPAGLFCAYLLAISGYKPLIIERGECVEDRINAVNKFFDTGILDKESNVQFGEGGAGTFSDGKLNTLTKDSFNRGKFVFETFVSCGAYDDILISNMPHIGTDILIEVIKNLRNKIISLGGEFLYKSKLTDIQIIDGRIKSIKINDKIKIDTDVLVLAIGHSARDTFNMLYKHNLNMEGKPFAVGIRIQHPQEIISKNQYGDKHYKILPPASYKLTYKTTQGRGVYSFCMCPGGYVVNASSEENRLAINGMSYNKRDSKNANSALVVTITQDDFGYHPLDGIKYQRQLEERAFKLGNGKIPTQLLGDYYKNRESSRIGDVLPVFKGEYNLTNLNNLYPDYINESLKEAISNFSLKINGFDNADSIISGVESRTSSPVRIVRNDEYESNILGIYPCGEGAGYAGGITTSSIDGIKVAEAIINKYRNLD